MPEKIIAEMLQQAHAFIRDNRQRFNSIAVAKTNADEYLLSVELFCVPFSQCLCAENGVIFEALKKGQRITHIMCLEWENDLEPNLVIPCGSCLERLLLFGDGVNIAVLSEADTIDFFPINDIFPANWFSLATQSDSSGSISLTETSLDEETSEETEEEAEQENNPIETEEYSETT